VSAKKIQVAEAGAKAFREGSSTGAKREITIIRAGWGSSGYYSEQVLERDIPRIFPSGSHMYLNHPTEAEDIARPERDLRDWVGVTETKPRMAGIDSVATATVFEHWQPVIDGIINGGGNLGLSIRAFGLAEEGPAAGREGPIIERLTEGLSIDYVTMPGAGGAVGPLTESLRQRMTPLIEKARLIVPGHVQEALDSELRESLNSVGTSAWGGDKIYVYCEDFDVDNNWAIFWINPDDNESFYYKTQFSRDTEGNVTLVGAPEKVKRDVNYVPTKESDATVLKEARNAGNYLEALIHRRFTEKADSLFGEGHITRDERIAMSSAIGSGLESFAAKLEEIAPQLFSRDPYEPLETPEVSYIEEKDKRGSDSRLKEEARMAEENGLSELRTEFRQFKESQEKDLKEAQDRADKAEKRAEEAETRVERAEEKDLRVEAMKIASRVLESGSAEKLSDKAKGRIIEAATRGDLPMDGERLDESIVQERTRAKARDELEYLGEALGVGRVEGSGGGGDLFQESSTRPAKSGDPAPDKALVEAFKRNGMSDEAAQRAAEGRG
jgi:hypothetical protein